MRIQSVIAAGALAAHAMACVAQDQSPSSGFYVAPQVSWVITDSDRAVDDEAAVAFTAGFQANRNWNFELSLFRGSFDGLTGNDLDLDAVGINALRVFRREERVAPYLLLGLGAQRSDLEVGGSSTDIYADAGAGLLTTLRKSAVDGRALFLRLDARARYTDSPGNPLDGIFGLGLQYAFGKAPAASRTSMPTQAVTEPPPAVTPPADEDGDGVTDDKDRCPGTPPGTAVDADGCALDSDGDGVVNNMDDCPNTPRGARVDARGCEPKGEIKLPVVNFDFDSDRLRPEATATLDQAAETLRENPSLRVEVAGHTDSRGPDAYNLNLSQRRAENVRRHLVDKGVTNELTVRGYGESEPIADNDTAAGRAKNRRVELRTLPQ